MKISDTITDIFVKKICENPKNLLTKDEIVTLWIRSGGSKSRIAYATSLLLGRKLIEPIARWLYSVIRWENQDVDGLYWDIVEKLILIQSPSWGIIWWEKSLELHLQNYSLPDILIIYTRDAALRIRLKNGREIHFRTLISGEKSWWKNLYRILLADASVFQKNKKILFLSQEAALLDGLSLRHHDSGIEEVNILRFLKSFHTKLSREKLGTLVRYRYIRALNRLRVLSRDAGYHDLYKKTLDIIRDEGGGCYLNI